MTTPVQRVPEMNDNKSKTPHSPELKNWSLTSEHSLSHTQNKVPVV